MGYGDLFVAGCARRACWPSRSVAPSSCAAPRCAARSRSRFDLLFFFVDELPATVPVALALIVVLAVRRRRSARPAQLGRLQLVQAIVLGLLVWSRRRRLRAASDRLRRTPRRDRARRHLDRSRRLHLAVGRGAGLLDPAHLRHHAVVEGADRLVVGGSSPSRAGGRPSPAARRSAPAGGAARVRTRRSRARTRRSALRASRSATAHSRPISVVGVAISICCWTPYSISAGSSASAAW